MLMSEEGWQRSRLCLISWCNGMEMLYLLSMLWLRSWRASRDEYPD